MGDRRVVVVYASLYNEIFYMNCDALSLQEGPHYNELSQCKLSVVT